MMLEVQGATLKSLPVGDLEWVQDLVAFDGPLLSLFRHRRHGDSYLYYWCDCDESVNRWMVLRVSETNVIRLVNRLIPLDHVIPKGCQDDFVYMVDTDGKCNTVSVILTQLEAIPADYTPAPGAFLGIEVAKQVGTYSVIIEQDLSIENIRDFFKEFSYAYAFLYNIVTLRSQRIRSHPWRGGFSAVHFWRELLAFIPSEDYPRPAAIQYASPGFVRFKLDSGIAIHVGDLVANYRRRHDAIREAYNNLNAFLSINKLNAEYVPDGTWEQHRDGIVKLTETLLENLRIPSQKEFIQAARRPYEAAKMATTFTRRLMELASMESNRIIRFPNSEEVESL